jgi:hypothetical protein
MPRYNEMAGSCTTLQMRREGKVPPSRSSVAAHQQWSLFRTSQAGPKPGLFLFMVLLGVL